MKKSLLTKVLAGFLCFAAVMPFTVFGESGHGEKADSRGFAAAAAASANPTSQKLYAISSDDTTVYSDADLTEDVGCIDESEELTALEIKEDYCKVKYHVSGRGTKIGFVKTDDLFSETKGHTYTSRGDIETYRRPGGESYGYISKHDRVLVLGRYGSYTQVRYRVPYGYRIAFIKNSDCRHYIMSHSKPHPKAQPKPRMVRNGWYMVVSGNSDHRVLGIQGWSKEDGGNLGLYRKFNTSNQQFRLRYLGNGYYSIRALNSGKYLQTEDENEEWTNVYQWDGCYDRNAQWSLKYAGHGYYYLKNRGNGSYLTNRGGRTVPGNNVVSRPFNGSDAQKWRFVRTSPDA